ncbi:hypothetical protein HDU85_007025 [Gaertneriomyces sp. JEL0708]|nr:hypothetical protein HDU85_007025 [Gaertneriomyces sp. JEL0708]
MSENATPLLAVVLGRSRAFHARRPFPTTSNRLEHILQQSPKSQQADVAISLEEHLQGARILVHPSLPDLITKFIALKKNHGTSTEQQVYEAQGITVWQDLVKRCISKRPLVFFTADDITVLRDGSEPPGGDWMRVGHAREGAIKMVDYLTYDEMMISALLGISAPSFFINNGDRFNAARPGVPGSFIDTGIVSALVGARYEIPHRMEWTYTVRHSSELELEESRGARQHLLKPSDALRELWTKFIRGQASQSDRVRTVDSYVPLRASGDYLLDTKAFRCRIGITLSLLLLDANNRAREAHTKAYVHVVGLGLGVWKVSPVQPQLFLEAAADALEMYQLPHVGVVNFSYFPDTLTECGGTRSGGIFSSLNGNQIRIEFSKRNPADPLDECDRGMLLVASFAWDGNSYVGNEYWLGSLTGSGDPAAACYSTIPETMNPDINVEMLSNIWVASE